MDSFRKQHSEMTAKETFMTIDNELGLVPGGELIARACSKYVPVYQYVFKLREPDYGWRAIHGAPCGYKI